MAESGNSEIEQIARAICNAPPAQSTTLLAQYHASNLATREWAKFRHALITHPVGEFQLAIYDAATTYFDAEIRRALQARFDDAISWGMIAHLPELDAAQARHLQHAAAFNAVHAETRQIIAQCHILRDFGIPYDQIVARADLAANDAAPPDPYHATV
jgi:hypothetical protein